MALITIREQSITRDATTGAFNAKATVSFDHGPEYSITVSDPFSKEEEEKALEWYFEEYLHFPFLEQVKYKQAAASITRYGEELFGQVFANHDAYSEYKNFQQMGLNHVQIEIAGSPAFHGWHWEALKDPGLPRPLAMQVTIVRKNLTPQTIKAQVRKSPIINLLVVVARPFGKGDVGYRTISRPLVESLRQSPTPVHIDILRPGTYQALDTHLRETTNRHGVGYYHVIHFDVHGALLTHQQFQQGHQANRYLFQTRYGRTDIAPYDWYKAFLFLEGEQDEQADPVEASELANLLLTYQIPIAILNACQSGKQVGEEVDASETSLGSRLMQAGMQQVLGK
jgi:hypothetical protein